MEHSQADDWDLKELTTNHQTQKQGVDTHTQNALKVLLSIKGKMLLITCHIYNMCEGPWGTQMSPSRNHHTDSTAQEDLISCGAYDMTSSNKQSLYL